MKRLLLLLLTIHIASCGNEDVSFAEQCDARQMGLNGNVQSVIQQTTGIPNSASYFTADLKQGTYDGEYSFNKQGNRCSPGLQYDKEGKLIRASWTNDADDEYSCSSYDTSGRLISSEWDGWDYEGNVRRKGSVNLCFSSDTLLIYTHRQKYEDFPESTHSAQIHLSNGRVVTFSIPDADTPTPTFSSENFNIVHLLDEEGLYESDDHFAIHFAYDSDGMLVQKYCQLGSRILYSAELKYDHLKRVIYCHTIGASSAASGDIPLNKWINAGYMQDGKPHYDTDAPNSEIKYNYNEYGDISRAEIILRNWRMNDSGAAVVTYDYEYDNQNNWTCRLTYINGALYEITQRELKYYGGKTSKCGRKYVQMAADIEAQKQQEREAERLRRQQQRIEAEIRRRQIEKQPIAVEPYICEFKLNPYDNTVRFHFAADLRNIGTKTYIDAASKEYYDTGRQDWLGAPIIEERLQMFVVFFFNKKYVLYTPTTDWGQNDFPDISYDSPWKPQQTKTLDIVLYKYEGDQVTAGYTAYMPKECILYVAFSLEDPDGNRIDIPLKYDLTDTWRNFANSLK